MNNHKASDGDSFSHTFLGPPYGKYNINNSELEEFYNVYNGAKEEGHVLHLTEVHKEAGPVIIDLDFKQDIDDKTRHYTDEEIECFIKAYNRLLIHYMDIPKKNKKLKSFVFEKKKPVVNKDKNRVDDGIHIMYPNLCVRYEIQHLIRLEMIKKMEKKELFVNDYYLNNLQSVYDKAVINDVNWLLYGSCKPKSRPYDLTKIYDCEMEVQIVDSENDDLNPLTKLLSIRKFEEEDILQLREELIGDIAEKLDKLNGVTKKDREKNINNNIQNEVVNNMQKYASQDDLQVAKDLVGLLDDDRADDYFSWLRVGWCLHNIDNTLLGSWIDFSKQSTKFIKGECEKMWRKFKNEGFGMGSLHHWAKTDNFDNYFNYKKEKVEDHIKQSVNGTHYDVASVMHTMYRNDFVCADLEKKLWYEFKNHRWHRIQKGYTLAAKISTDILNEYALMNSKMYEEISRTSDQDKKESLLKKVEMIQKILNKLKDSPFKDNIMKECRFLFFDQDFFEKLNENRDLICFTNGVYDLENKTFRDGSPDDCISFCTNCDYEPYNKNDKHVKEVMKFFSQIQPDEEIMSYVLTLLSSYLQGHTPDEKFHIVTGTGANGKSKMIELVQMGMGDYATGLPVQLLTQKRSGAESASPVLAKTKGKRFGTFSEPEKNDQLRVGLMKELTGGDVITAREMYMPPVEFKPQFKLLLACNELPHIPASDQGTWRRLRVVEFKSKFVSNPDPKKPNEHPIDKYLTQKFDNWKVALMSILVHKFKDYKENGIEEPDEVIKFTKKYEADSDIYAEYVSENLIETEDMKKGVPLSTLYNSYKTWIKSAYTDRKCVGKKEFKENIVPKLGDKNVKKEKVYGYVLKVEESDEEDPLENLLD
jgi:P4 family phage/plasmid primase-like protien